MVSSVAFVVSVSLTPAPFSVMDALSAIGFVRSSSERSSGRRSVTVCNLPFYNETLAGTYKFNSKHCLNCTPSIAV